MSQNSDISNHVIKGRLKDRFNRHADSDAAELSHDKAMDALDEANINTGLIMGSDTHIGRQDTFHFHVNEERKKDRLEQKRKSDQRLYRLFIHQYLETLRSMIDEVQLKINKLLQQMAETEAQLTGDLEALSQNEQLLDRLSDYMNRDHFERRNDLSLQDDELHDLIVLLGHDLSSLTDNDIRKLIDTHAHKIREDNDSIKERILINTKNLERDSETLTDYQGELDRLKNLENEVKAISSDINLSDEEKYETLMALQEEEGVSIDGLDQLWDDTHDLQNEMQALGDVSDLLQVEDKKTSDKLDNASFSAFLPKP